MQIISKNLKLTSAAFILGLCAIKANANTGCESLNNSLWTASVKLTTDNGIQSGNTIHLHVSDVTKDEKVGYGMYRLDGVIYDDSGNHYNLTSDALCEQQSNGIIKFIDFNAENLDFLAKDYTSADPKIFTVSLFNWVINGVTYISIGSTTMVKLN